MLFPLFDLFRFGSLRCFIWPVESEIIVIIIVVPVCGKLENKVPSAPSTSVYDNTRLHDLTLVAPSAHKLAMTSWAD